MQNPKSDNVFVTETISSWSYSHRVLTHAVMSILLDFNNFKPVKELTKSVNYTIFAFDVVAGYLNGKNQTDAASDLMIADSALAHSMDLLRNWVSEHTPMESPVYFNMCSFFMMIPFLIAEMPEVEDGLCYRLLKTIELENERQTFHSKEILEYALLLHDESMKRHTITQTQIIPRMKAFYVLKPNTTASSKRRKNTMMQSLKRLSSPPVEIEKRLSIYESIKQEIGGITIGLIAASIIIAVI